MNWSPVNRIYSSDIANNYSYQMVSAGSGSPPDPPSPRPDYTSFYDNPELYRIRLEDIPDLHVSFNYDPERFYVYMPKYLVSLNYEPERSYVQLRDILECHSLDPEDVKTKVTVGKTLSNTPSASALPTSDPDSKEIKFYKTGDIFVARFLEVFGSMFILSLSGMCFAARKHIAILLRKFRLSGFRK